MTKLNLSYKDCISLSNIEKNIYINLYEEEQAAILKASEEKEN